MKLYTRLMDAGVFIFWSTDGKDSTYNLKISAIIGEEAVKLVDINADSGVNYYTFDRVGAGEYEIELNAYKNEKLCQTEFKKIKLVSSVQDTVTLLDTLLPIKREVVDISTDVNEIKDYIKKIWKI